MAQVPSPDLQKQTIKKEIENELVKLGDSWYLISLRWYKLWKEFVGWEDEEQAGAASNDTTQNPQAVDNSDLLDPDYRQSTTNDFVKLKRNLSEDYDYVLVSEPVWNFLHQWYGGGPVIRRGTVEIGEGSTQKVIVEVYPLILQVYKTKESGLMDQSTDIEIIITSKAPMKELRQKGCSKLHIDPEKVRVWHFTNPPKMIDDESKSLEELAIDDDQKILFEVQLPNGSWPRDPPEIPKTSSQTSDTNGTTTTTTTKKKKKGILGFLGFGTSSSSSSSSSTTQSISNGKLGLCGLVNLGNTCFMNSALQCLSNTVPMTDYFIKNHYKSEINRTNVLGMKGKIAEEYGALIKQLWAPSNTNSSVAPRSFKTTIGKFAPQFSGYSQNDSQELLAFLLDGLHEDLNRVPKKPFIEVKEMPDMPDEEVAQIYWENHLKRDRSIIVDLFQGQLKSKLVCPKCNHVSICFDPFMYLSLPLPVEKYTTYDVIFMKNAEPYEYPIKFTVRVDKQGKIEDLKESLSKVIDIPVSQLILADLYNNRLYAFLSESKSVTTIRSNDVTVAYEIPENTAEMIRVTVVNRRIKKKSEGSYSSSIELFGFPFLIYIDGKKTTQKQIYEQIWNKVKSFVKSKSEESQEKEEEEQKDKPKKKKEKKKKEEPKQEPENDQVNGEPEELNPFPFTLSIVSSTGSSCGRCTALSCNGCPVSYKDKPNKFKGNDPISIAIDWDPKFLAKSIDPDYPKSFRLHSSVEEFKKQPAQSVTLTDCLNIFTTDERLGANDMWYCPKCKEHHRAMKKFDLWNLPQVLVIHLKRFQFTKWSREKLNTFVDFPLEGLDLSSAVLNKSQKPPVYDLFAVSNHVGSFHGGHYYSYAKNRYDNQWYCFNDSSCSPAKVSEIVSPAAYVLFYIRRDSVPTSS